MYELVLYSGKFEISRFKISIPSIYDERKYELNFSEILDLISRQSYGKAIQAFIDEAGVFKYKIERSL